ncbi:MAG: antibiotic hydrolase [Candidatus Nephthysia bennettiae]|nr:MAG: antibiotic hydrolase [Candidatus Dormibacteraeota bacterium]
MSERPRSSPSQQDYGIVVARDVMVPMRDRVRLACDIYYPALAGSVAEGPWPTILGRTSYDKSNETMWVKPVGEFFGSRGYVVVCQDLRGRYRSEGYGEYRHTANRAEGTDGYDTIEWIARQPWSNGKVGMTGSSHGAIVQQVAALHSPPHLVTIWPDVGPTNNYAHESREGGAMSLQMFGALFMHAFDAQEVHAQPGAQAVIVTAMEHMRDWVQRAPFKPGHTPLSVVPALEQTLFDYYWRGIYDEFWSHECNDQERYWDERHPDIPATYSGGWWDPFSGGTTRYHSTMSARNTTPQKLIMGPWTHTGMRSGLSYQGDADFGPDSVWGIERYNQERLRWFDRWLKDVPNHVEDDPGVRIFVMGGGDGHRTAAGHFSQGGAWREEREWPLSRTRYAKFHLFSAGTLSEGDAEATAGGLSFAFDPARPVPTIGGSIVSFYEIAPLMPDVDQTVAEQIPWGLRMRNIVPAGGYDQVEQPGFVGAAPPYLSLASRSDVLVFQTPPLDAPIEVTGPITVRLWISSSAPDTDFTAKLIDVCPSNPDYPNGYHLALVDSIIRARYREGWDREVLMDPGRVYEVEIALPPTSNLFGHGHRIRLDISSSNFPRFDVNPNTGEPVGRHTHTQVARNTVHVGRDCPSHVVLPVIPP